MSIDVHALEELQARVTKLEMRNRQQKRFGAIALIAVMTMLVMGQSSSRKTVEADEFLLRDTSGSVRARLSMNQSDPEMIMLDDKGRPRIKISGREAVGGGAVSVFDAQGQLSAGLSGTPFGGHISLLNSKGRSMTTISPGDLWLAGGIRLEDDDGFAAWLGRTGLLYEGEAQTASAASLILVDNPHRKVLWKAP